MDAVELFLIKKRAVRSIAALASGTVLLQIITLVSQFILTIFLLPAAFGIFSLLNAAVGVLSYFSDIGLAAALIQKKDEPAKSDLTTTFTIQQALAIILSLSGLILSQFIARFYNLDENGLWLLRALVFSFFLASLKTIPHILLERSLQFTKLTFVNIFETSVFYLTIIILAIRGYGISSFTYGVLGRGISGLILIYVLSPWKPELNFEKGAAKNLLNFGVPMQLNSLLALIKDNLFIMLLGKLITPAQLGYYGWAKSWSEAPLRLVMDSLSRVMFPLYARLQNNLGELSKAIEKTLYFQSALIFPFSLYAGFFARPLVNLIPKYGKWIPAIPLFYLFVISSTIVSSMIPLTHVLNATGKVKTTLKYMTFWTLLVWLITPVMVLAFGYVGTGYAALLVAFSYLFLIPAVGKLIPLTIHRSFQTPVFASFTMCLVLIAARPLMTGGLMMIILSGVMAGITYTGVFYWLDRKRLFDEFKFIANSIKTR